MCLHSNQGKSTGEVNLATVNTSSSGISNLSPVAYVGEAKISAWNEPENYRQKAEVSQRGR